MTVSTIRDCGDPDCGRDRAGTHVDPSVFDGDCGRIVCFLRDGDRVFLTYGSTGRGVEAIMSSLKLLDMTVYGRREPWEDSPEGWPQRPTYAFWRRDGRPTAQWTRPGATPVSGGSSA